MSLPQTTGAYALGPGEGEALWFNGALGLVKASGLQTDGRFAAVEFLAPKGFLSPLHIHRAEDEFFLVLSGEVRALRSGHSAQRDNSRAVSPDHGAPVSRQPPDRQVVARKGA